MIQYNPLLKSPRGLMPEVVCVYIIHDLGLVFVCLSVTTVLCVAKISNLRHYSSSVISFLLLRFVQFVHHSSPSGCSTKKQPA